MKIGIITYYAVCNFGANLQALSTFEYLKKNGHIPIIISWYPKQLEQQYEKNTPREQFNAHRQFREKYFDMTERCYTTEDVVHVIEKHQIEAVIVGSDAVVQYTPHLSRIVFPCRKIYAIQTPGVDRDCPSPFWGNFHKLLKRPIPMAMMSVSCQNTPYKTLTRKEKRLLSDHLLRFSYISTRDDWTRNQLSFATGNKISPTITPDPVFAYNYNVDDIPSKEDICKRFDLPEKYALASFHNSRTVSQEWLRNLETSMAKRNTVCIAFPFPQGVEFEHPFKREINLPLDPMDWYALIKHSSAYIGHNMHPIVVCLSNAVPCFSFDHYGKTKMRWFVDQKSSKIYHIMKHFNVLQNRVNSAGKFIDHPSVDDVMNRLDAYDVVAIKKIACEYLEQYKKMMADILDVFVSSKQ